MGRMPCATGPALRECAPLYCGVDCATTPHEAAAGMGRKADAGRGQRQLGAGACVFAGAGASHIVHGLRELNQEAEPGQGHRD